MKMRKNVQIFLYTLSLAAILWYPAATILKIEFPKEPPVEMKFAVRAVDPYDPLRGRYVRLTVFPNEIAVPEGRKFNRMGKVFLVLEKKRDGFARAVRLAEDRGEIAPEEIFVKVGGVYRLYNPKNNEWKNAWHFTLPFSFFYLNELDAPELEAELLNRSRSTKDKDMVLTVQFFKDGLFAVKKLEAQKGKK
ncbi:MAG: GDYXXLXY domain-containing protein [Lentisphaeria bacterium]|nr:GDYXXLXY domain-containing protein [Lentisphaeria bacterium]